MQLEKVIRSFDEPIALSIQQASVKGFVSGAESATNKLPKKVRDRLAYLPDVGDLSTPPPTPDSLASVAEGEPEVFFPGLERAAEKLVEAKTITPQDYYALSAEARKQAFTISGEITQESVEKIREILAEQMSESGVSLDAFERDVEERLGELPINEAHLEGVFRNAINSAYSEGQEHVLSSGIVSDEFPYRAYYAIHDARARHTHSKLEKLGLSGTNVYLATDPVWREFQPPWEWSCFLPGTVVGGVFDTGFKSWYDGEAVEIVTARGHRLAVTVNHPILTPAGFVAAGELSEFDYAITDIIDADFRLDSSGSFVGSVGSTVTLNSVLSSPNLNKEHAPAVIEEVFGTLALAGDGWRVKVGKADFHGDAERFDGDVEIVSVDRILLNDIKSSIPDNGCNFTLSLVDVGQIASPGLGHSDEFLARLDSPCTDGPCTSTLPLDSSTISLDGFPFQSLRIGAASRINASLFESVANSSPADIEMVGQCKHGLASEMTSCDIGGIERETEFMIATTNFDTSGFNRIADTPYIGSNLACNLVDRHPGLIASDQIISVERFQYSGHVYDLRSKNGWVNANHIYASNCRCSWVGLSIEQAAREGVKHAIEWLKAINAAKEDGTFDGWNEHYMPEAVYVKHPDFNAPAEWRR